MTYQLDWAWCSTCQTLHYAGFEGPYKGACAGSHTEHSQQASPHYAVAFDLAPRDGLQQQWASCSRCRALYFAGFADHQGACPAGGQHDRAASFGYAVPFDDSDERLEQGWACCSRCRCLHWAGQELRGSCPAGGVHDTAHSFAYAVHRLPTEARLRWTGLECRIRQERLPEADEIFGGITVVTQDGQGSSTHLFPEDRTYWQMGADPQRIVVRDAELYRGPATGLSLTMFLTEWDSDEGSVRDLRKFLEKAVADAAGRAADSYAPGSGQVAGPVLEALVGEIIGFGEKLFGVGNDPYSPGSLTLSQADTIGAPADRHVLTRSEDPKRVSYTHLVEVSGVDDRKDRGVYAFYFLLDRAAPVPLWQRERSYVPVRRRVEEGTSPLPIGG